MQMKCLVGKMQRRLRVRLEFREKMKITLLILHEKPVFSDMFVKYLTVLHCCINCNSSPDTVRITNSNLTALSIANKVQAHRQ